ncbi:MAG: Ribonuclease HII [Candidatus Dichloromethanomonas elyunquensis]|nr:MAG: Ribonuclease HII [Candidatus Dichloromethanomonas elyunquensis]
MDEVQRMITLTKIENELRRQGYRLVAGIDEAGRGPLAGPVIASACILPEKFNLPGLNDSKKLTEKKREDLAYRIKEQAVAFSLGSATSKEIDLLNILKATLLAMKRALENLQPTPDYILIDGRDNLNTPILHKTMVGGDGLCACIAAASILAKVARDELMCEMNEIYPEYCFDRHKGYGTRLHLDTIYQFGPCPIHRQSFSPIKEIVSQNRIG